MMCMGTWGYSLAAPKPVQDKAENGKWRFGWVFGLTYLASLRGLPIGLPVYRALMVSNSVCWVCALPVGRRKSSTPHHTTCKGLLLGQRAVDAHRSCWWRLFCVFYIIIYSYSSEMSVVWMRCCSFVPHRFFACYHTRTAVRVFLQKQKQNETTQK